MPFTLIANEIKGNDFAGATTDAANTTGANLLVAATHWYSGGTTPTFTDSKGNTWTALTQRGIGNSCVRIYYCIPTSVGSGHTFSAVGSNSYAVVSMSAWSGAASSSVFDTENGASGGNVSSLDSGAVSPSQDDSLIISVVTHGMGTTTVSGGSLATTDTWDSVTSASMGGAMAYEIQTTATSRAASWSWSGSYDGPAAAIAAFKVAGASGPANTLSALFLSL